MKKPLIIISILIIGITAYALWPVTLIEKTITHKTEVYAIEGGVTDPIFWLLPGDKCLFGEESGASKAYIHVKVYCKYGEGWIIGRRD